jgi:exosortase
MSAASDDASATAIRGASAWLALLIPTAIVATIFWPLFPELIRAWNTDPNYSHGYIVPLVSLTFAWMAWRDSNVSFSRVVPRREFIEGVLQIVFGFILHLGMWFTRNFFLDSLTLICVLHGLLLVWGGRPASRTYGFSLLFLMFAAPLPIHWYQPVALFMQELVSQISALLLQLIGVPVHREGYYLHLPGFTMEIAEACSGLRQLVAIVALGVAIGHFSGRGSVFRWSLGLLAIPIAVIANCVRVVLSGVLVMNVGREWGEGFFHAIEGLAIIAISAGLLVSAAWGLARLEDKRSQKHASSAPAV